MNFILKIEKFKKSKNIKDLKADDLLVGDIILISGGETIPADCLLLEGNGIKI